jgi:hypothetical protein
MEEGVATVQTEMQPLEEGVLAAEQVVLVPWELRLLAAMEDFLIWQLPPQEVQLLVVVLKAESLVAHQQMLGLLNMVVLAEVLVVMGHRIVPVLKVAPLYSGLAVEAEEDRRVETLQGLVAFGVRIPQVEVRRLVVLTRRE